MPSLFHIEDLSYDYIGEKIRFPALRNISWGVNAGEAICLAGPSGSGKTTLLNLLGLIELPQRGRLVYDGREISSLSEPELNRIRRFEIGFVFQSFQLFPVLTARENVEFFLQRQGLSRNERINRSESALKRTGLWDHRDKRPLEMSGGQRQRVAIARAIAKKPRVIIADEPTASLDSATGREVMDCLITMQNEDGVTLLVSSHDPMVQAALPTILKLKDGRIDGRSA